MPAPTATADIHGDKRAMATLVALGRRARDARPAADDVRRVFTESEREHFESDGRGQWPALAATTAARKARQGQDPRILRATGALYRSLTSDDAGAVDEARPESMRFGTDVPYAGFHDTGSGVPKRALVDLSFADRRRIVDVLGRYIARSGGRI